MEDQEAPIDRFGKDHLFVVVGGYATSSVPIFLVIRRDNQLWGGQGVYHCCEIISDAGERILTQLPYFAFDCWVRAAPAYASMGGILESIKNGSPDSFNNIVEAKSS